MNYVFANRSDDDEIYPITVKEIAQEQKKDKSLVSSLRKTNTNYTLWKILKVLCKDGKVSHSKIATTQQLSVGITITYNTLDTHV
jgi:hypothetical protein